MKPATDRLKLGTSWQHLFLLKSYNFIRPFQTRDLTQVSDRKNVTQYLFVEDFPDILDSVN